MRRIRYTHHRLATGALTALTGIALTFGGLEQTHFLGSAESASVAPSSSVVAGAPATIAPTPVNTPAVAATGLSMDRIDNDQIDRWISRLTTTFKSDFERSLTRMGKYGEM